VSDVLELHSAPRELAGWRWPAYLELAKPRISLLVLVTTAVGYYLSAREAFVELEGFRLFHTLVGTALAAMGANALNQFREMEWDRRMIRTESRPLPAGRLSAGQALFFGAFTAVGGSAYLAWFVNGLAGALAASSCAIYLFAYTPLKRRTPLCVFVGAVSGALPPLIGWAGGSGELSLEAWLLFAILFIWQLPHFAAIAWLYREDYARAGFPMIGVGDPDGISTNLHVMTHSFALLFTSLLPVFLGKAGVFYAAAAVALGMAFLAYCSVFAFNKTPRLAKGVVLASIVYLPLLFGALLLDRWPALR
jgi:protoheme IX farnesyltransferase